MDWRVAGTAEAPQVAVWQNAVDQENGWGQ